MSWTHGQITEMAAAAGLDGAAVNASHMASRQERARRELGCGCPSCTWGAEPCPIGKRGERAYLLAGAWR